MKRVILIVTGLLFYLSFATLAQQQAQMIIHKTNGQINTYNISDIDSVTFIDCNQNNNNSDQICNQIWMSKNLNVDHYRNGDSIPQVTDPLKWNSSTTGAWCYYNNDPAMGAIYGKLYNWYAVNDPRGLAPEGWHIPSDNEWKELEMCLGMTKEQADSVGIYGRGNDEGGKLKSTGTIEAGNGFWISPNIGATNISGFTALPGAWRSMNGTFQYISELGSWWSSTQTGDGEFVFTRYLQNVYSTVRRDYGPKNGGFSVRCIKD